MRPLAPLMLLGVLVGACGGAAPGLGTPPGRESVDDLVRELEASERQLLAETPVTTEATAPSGGGAETPGAGDVESKAPEATASTAPSSTCDTACKALASMRRSASRICEIAGPESERCSWANQKIADADARVKRAGCACPSE